MRTHTHAHSTHTWARESVAKPLIIKEITCIPPSELYLYRGSSAGMAGVISAI